LNINKFTIQKSFAINAGAGSGKTYTLSRRFINALVGFDYFREEYEYQEDHYDVLKPATVDEIVTITYTEAAALEMKGRIFELVRKILIFDSLDANDGDFSSIEEANAHINTSQKTYLLEKLQKAYTQSANAKISTIHAFCLDIIKANADIAKIDTKLDIIKDDEKAKELSSIIFEVLNDDKNRDLVLDISADVSMFFMDKFIEKYISSSKFRKDLDGFNQESISVNTYKKIISELYPLPDIQEAQEELEEDTLRLEWLTKYYENFYNFNAKAWKDVNPSEKTPSLGDKSFPVTNLFKTALDKLVQYYAPIDTELEALFFTKIAQLKTLLSQIKSSYDTRLQELGKIDFDTIITKTLEIIPTVDSKYKYIMVDEFQDTNAIQFDIVKESCGSDTNLFVVGDSKQSIYSFQGAEIEIFNDAINDTNMFTTVADMSQNHRSDGVVLENVNDIFDHLLQPKTHLNLISQNYEAQAQKLTVFKEKRAKKGSFEFLFTSKPYEDEELNELDSIAQLVANIAQNKEKRYKNISTLVQEKKKAIAILFDSSTKMLLLKQKLRKKGITAKVSASEDFYQTREVNDIFNLLKALYILQNTKESYTAKEKYFLAGAMRSNILRVSDDAINQHFINNTIPVKLKDYKEILNTNTLSQAIKQIVDESNLLSVYTHLNDVEQVKANIEKFLHLALEYEQSDESSLYRFLALLENSIYMSEAKEDEAFYKSESSNSIEICSIHSTKGLAYPLVLLANAEKSLFSQITSDSLKHNSFTLSGEKKEIVGFKLKDYIPLSHRVVKEIDKLKHFAEKKRLLYVALTRAEHDVIISATLAQKKDGGISLREDSYLAMILGARVASEKEITVVQELLALYNPNNNIKIEPIVQKKRQISYQTQTLEALEFTPREKLISATQSASDLKPKNNKAAELGTLTHKIIEMHWQNFQDNSQAIFHKHAIYDKNEQEIISKHMQNFYASDVCTALKNGAQHQFELEFILDDKHGFIDLIYFDMQLAGWVIIDFKTGTPSNEKEELYQAQLDFYKDVMESLNYKVVACSLLWI